MEGVNRTTTLKPPSFSSDLSRMSSRRLLLTASVGALAVVAAVAPGPLPSSPAHAASVATIGPSHNLQTYLSALYPGDVLRLMPGVYNVGEVRVQARRGTPTMPITVTAVDPANPPMIMGSLKFFAADYWRISRLRVKSTVPGKEALWMAGGTGWTVSYNEFWGARDTGAYANVTIGGNATGSPRGFRFSANCVHDAAQTTRGNTDHNIYVNFPGNSSTGGQIDHNIIWGHGRGVGIKLGNGGAIGALGPWGVMVQANTVTEGGRQILLHGNVRNNTIRGNLLGISRAPFQKSPKTTITYVNKVTTRTNRFERNYMWAASMGWYDPEGRLIVSANKLGAAPAMTGGVGCAGFKTTGTFAYGRWGTGRY